MWLLAMASGAAVFILTPDVWTLALAAGIVLVPLAGMAGAFAARKAGGEEVSVTLPQAVTVAISGATVTPEVKVAEDGTASIDGTVVAGTGAAYEPEEDTSEGAGTGDTDAAASTDTAAADKEAHDTPAGETHTALWVALAAVVIACAVLLIVKRKGATK